MSGWVDTQGDPTPIPHPRFILMSRHYTSAQLPTSGTVGTVDFHNDAYDWPFGTLPIEQWPAVWGNDKSGEGDYNSAGSNFLDPFSTEPNDATWTTDNFEWTSGEDDIAFSISAGKAGIYTIEINAVVVPADLTGPYYVAVGCYYAIAATGDGGAALFPPFAHLNGGTQVFPCFGSDGPFGDATGANSITTIVIPDANDERTPIYVKFGTTAHGEGTVTEAWLRCLAVKHSLPTAEDIG